MTKILFICHGKIRREIQLSLRHNGFSMFYFLIYTRFTHFALDAEGSAAVESRERVPKEIASLGFGRRATPAKKAKVIQELSQEHNLTMLLEIVQLPGLHFIITVIIKVKRISMPVPRQKCCHLPRK